MRRSLAVEYHSWALEVLRSFPFKGARERRVWSLHCDGHGANAIDRMLAHRRARWAPRGRPGRALFVIRRVRSEAAVWMACRNLLPATTQDLAALEAGCDPAIIAQLRDLQARYGPDVETMRAHLGEWPELAELLDHD